MDGSMADLPVASDGQVHAARLERESVGMQARDRATAAQHLAVQTEPLSAASPVPQPAVAQQLRQAAKQTTRAAHLHTQTEVPVAATPPMDDAAAQTTMLHPSAVQATGTAAGGSPSRRSSAMQPGLQAPALQSLEQVCNSIVLILSLWHNAIASS